MLDRKHYLDLADGKFHQTSPADLAALFKAVEYSPSKDHLVVHFHGGLVSRKSAGKAADGLLPSYVAGNAYPIFFFWRSDLWTTISKNLDEVAKEPIFQRLVKRLLQLAIGKFSDGAGARSVGRVPLKSEADMPDDPEELAKYAAAREPDPKKAKGATLSKEQKEQAEEELETDPIIRRESTAIAVTAAPAKTRGVATRAAGGRGVKKRKTRMSPKVINELVSEMKGEGARFGGALLTVASKGAIILGRVVVRYAKQSAHGLYATIAEEILRELYLDGIGGTVWALMKKDTLDAFRADPKVYGGTAFLEKLKNWWKPGRKITLVGHSTGAIYIGNLLEQADAKLDPAVKFDVVFLAPACTFTFLHEKLGVFMRRVKRMRSFGLKDDLESGYWEVPVIYPASLLYLVSGLFEDPIVDCPLVGMERYFSGRDPYTTKEIKDVTKYLENKCVWALAPGCSARRHGGFDGDPMIRTSLKKFLLE
jgi:hypothetical protein